jgi:hypothetical protein
VPANLSIIRVIGRREFVSFPSLGIQQMEAKIDTGAYTSSIHCKNIHVKKEGEEEVLYFTLSDHPSVTGINTKHRFTDFSKKTIKNSFGEMEERFTIKTLLKIGKKKIKASVSLSDRGSMRYPVLIGRKPLKGKFLIDVNSIHTGGIKLSGFVPPH